MIEPILMQYILYASVELNTVQKNYPFFADDDDVEGVKYNKEIETSAVIWVINNQFDIGCSLLCDQLQIEKPYLN